MRIVHDGRTLIHIRSHWDGLTRKEKRVAQYILEYAQDVIYYSVTQLAEKVDVGETTVIRFCRQLQFRGFQDFKLSLAQDLVKPADHLPKELNEDDDFQTLAGKIIGMHLRTLDHTRELMNPDQLGDAIDWLIESKAIRFFGVGSSGLTAKQAAHSFTRIGKICSATTDTHFQAVQASLMTMEEVAVGFSISGSTKDTIENLTVAKETGARIIVITSNARSPITKVADIVLLTVSHENPMQGSSQTAQISQLAVLDILFVAVSFRIKEQAVKFREITAKSTTEKLY